MLLLNLILILGFLSHSSLKEKSQKREIKVFFPHRTKYRGRRSTVQSTQNHSHVMSLGVKPTHVNNCEGHDSSVQQFSVQNDDESWGKLYLGYNNRFLNMNSFYAKFTYTQNTFYLIKQIHLNHKKFSSHSYWATEN